MASKRISRSQLVTCAEFEIEWLVELAGHSVKYSINEENEPFFKVDEFKLFCYVDLTFGSKNWVINKVKLPFPKEDRKYWYYWARFMLEGKMIKDLWVSF